MSTRIDTDWCWPHFEKGPDKYKNDKSHYESRCKACMAHRVEELKGLDKQDIEEGNREYVRDEEALNQQGVSVTTSSSSGGG